MKLTILFFLILIIVHSSFAQVLKVKVKIEYQHLTSEEQEELKELGSKIEDYYNNYSWTEDEYETDIDVNIYVIMENVRKKSHEKIYKAQFQIRSVSGESFYDKEWEFPYHRNYPLEHNKIQFDPITRFLDFYANLILAGELDTYGLTLGTPYYDSALDIASQASISQYPTGWSNRIKEHEKITNIRTRPLREAKPDFFEALYYLEEKNIKEARKYGRKVLDKIEKIYRVQPNNKYLKLFFDAHYKEFGILFKGDNNTLNQLVKYDPLHKDLYRQYADN